MKCNDRLTIIGAVCLIVFMVSGFTPWVPESLGAQSGPIMLKFAHQNPPKGRTTENFMTPWAKSVEDATHGKVKITQYPAESLVKAREIVSGVEGGVADIGWSPMGYFPGRFPLTDVMTLPFFNVSGAKNNSLILQQLYENIPEVRKHFANLKLLFMNTSDPYVLITTKKPVRNLDDLKGMKIRVLGSTQDDTFKRLGASPLFMPMPGTYSAAEKGVIDGAVMPWAAVATFRLWEVMQYWTDIPVFLGTFFVFMNLNTWNGLPPDVQKGVMSVSGLHGAEFAARTQFGPEIYDEITVKAKKVGKAVKRVPLDPGEFEKWKKIGGEPAWDQWVDQMEKKGLPGRMVFEKARKLMEQYK
ncbi:MAG: TRAP transporter substrate-binding protein [Pseudomonadota bacterium]